MPLIDPRPANSVIVELVIDRPFKDDCRAGTPTVWRGKGDRNYYPVALWPKLAEHPDVWALVDEAGVVRPSDISPQDALKREAAAAAKLLAARSETAAVQQAAAAAATETSAVPTGEPQGADAVQADQEQAQREEAAGQGIDMVHAVPDADFADTFDYAAMTQEAQDAMSVEDMRALAVSLDYGLHPRLGEPKLRAQFAELTTQRLEQLHEEVDTTGVDEGVVPVKKD